MKDAKELELQSRECDEYWGAFLGVGGGIWDDPTDTDNPPNLGYSNMDYCKEMYLCDWINTHDVLAFEGVIEET